MRLTVARFRHLAALALCVACTACSGTTPSDARVASQIAGQFNREFGAGLVQVDHLQQSQGHLDGHKHYVAHVEYDLTFTKGLNRVKRETGSTQATELYVIFGDFRAGETRHFANKVIFSKHEKGWVLTDSRRE